MFSIISTININNLVLVCVLVVNYFNEFDCKTLFTVIDNRFARQERTSVAPGSVNPKSFVLLHVERTPI